MLVRVLDTAPRIRLASRVKREVSEPGDRRAKKAMSARTIWAKSWFCKATTMLWPA